MFETDKPARKGALFPRPFLLCAVFALLSTLLLAEIVPRIAPGLLRFDHILGDVRIAQLSDRLATQHPKVALVTISDETLKDRKVRQPIDRALLARTVDAIDAAGAKVIGLDILSVQATPPDNQGALVDAIKRARAKIVLAAADERVGLSKEQMERQTEFLGKAGRPAGYINLAAERDWVVRFKAGPARSSAYPKSFATLLAEAAGVPEDNTYRRIPWLLTPRDGSDTFLSIPAETLLKNPDSPAARIARGALKDKIVIIGGTFPDLDRHLTPLTSGSGELQSGAVIHAHTVAALVDGRRVVQLETDSVAVKLELIVIAGLAFLVGWRTRKNPQGLLFGTAATVAIIAVDTVAFWLLRIILPFVLALIAWFLGEFTGHYIGRWLGDTERSKWVVK